MEAFSLARTAAGENARPAARDRLRKLRPRACSACLVLSECGVANPLLDVNAIVSPQLHVRSSNLYLQNTHYCTVYFPATLLIAVVNGYTESFTCQRRNSVWPLILACINVIL